MRLFYSAMLAIAILSQSDHCEALTAGDTSLQAVVTAAPVYQVGAVSPLIYGHFLEHFHRVVYGGIYDPDSPLSDERGFRKDVIEAMRRIHVPVLRWPGGCFASAYHWQDGIGRNRPSTYDKAWRVLDTNAFGTDEFIAFCRAAGTEPYICGNAGTGTPEELSDWLEYCNLNVGKWARLRSAQHPGDPYRVRFWSIGNENWGGHEIGAKTAAEFARFVTETAKMMRRVDGAIQLLAPSVPDLEWNKELLNSAGEHIDYIAIHGYADPLWQNNTPAPYARCAKWSMDPESLIARTEDLLRALGNARVKIAYDEWNLRGWHHPDFTARVANIAARDLNDLNRTYTCADAVYAGCFLNACLRHADRVGMANFAPLVNTRGAIFTHKDGIVLRPTYHVFDIYTNHALTRSLDTAVVSDAFRADGVDVPAVDAVMTYSDDGRCALAAVNRHNRRPATITLKMPNADVSPTAVIWTVTGADADSFNDVGHPNEVAVRKTAVQWNPAGPSCTLEPHSVNVVCFTAAFKAGPLTEPLANGDLESLAAPTLPYAWRPVQWSGLYRAALDVERPHSAKRCVLLESTEGADCAWMQRIRVQPHSRYRLSGWIRTENLKAETGKGAFLNLQEIQGPTTPPLSGTHDWTKVELVVDTAGHEMLQVNCVLGGWGRSCGKAWFDDLHMEQIGKSQ